MSTEAGFDAESSEFEGIGAVKSFQLPFGWVDSKLPEEYPGQRRIKIFQPLEASDMHFLICVREAPLSYNGSQKFIETLYSPFHELTNEERESLHEVLGPISNHLVFELEKAETGYLNGRRCILAIGKSIVDNVYVAAVFVDAEGNGVFVHEIILTADLEIYDFDDQAILMFETIEWN